ncbi:hypothetical protein J6590_097310 [Homalodisca vitripennis]|nr:hypothetical protein J6590_097310 [Homalodisca vitripennis]
MVYIQAAPIYELDVNALSNKPLARGVQAVHLMVHPPFDFEKRESTRIPESTHSTGRCLGAAVECQGLAANTRAIPRPVSVSVAPAKGKERPYVHSKTAEERKSLQERLKTQIRTKAQARSKGSTGSPPTPCSSQLSIVDENEMGDDLLLRSEFETTQGCQTPLRGFDIFREDFPHDGHACGGVALFVDESLGASEVPLHSNLQCVCVSIQVPISQGVIPHIKIRKKGLINIGPKMLSYQVIQGERFRLNFSSPAATKPYGYLLAVN